MNDALHTGKLKRWNDDKGFGFITSASGGADVFLHISAVRRMSRRPLVGDIIVYRMHTDQDGKKRAVNARIQGVAEVKPSPIRKGAGRKAKSRPLAGVLPVLLMISLGLLVYDRFFARTELRGNSTPLISSYTEKNESTNNYRCQGKVYCSEMTSCKEAKFYLRNCPGTKMDGDGDGVPCERQWCAW